jgi:pro-kumamolisin-like protein
VAKSSDHRPLQGSERHPIPGSTLLGPVEGKELITVTVILRQKPGSPELPDLQHWQDTPPSERTFLSPEEFYDLHGAAQDELDTVVDYLSDKGLRVVEKHAGRRRVVVEGTASQLNSAFGVRLNRYRMPERFVPRPEPKPGQGRPFGDHLPVREQEYHSFEGAIRLPADLVELITTVIGLDNRRLGISAGNGTGDPPGAAYLSPAKIARDYNFPTNVATGQTIGIFEDAFSGAAYLHADITSFIHSLPGGATLPLPSLADIGLLGYSNNAALVTNPPTGAAFECNIDVSIAAAAALGANVNVYFTDDSDGGWDAFFDRAIFPLPGDNPPSVLTASWVPYLSDDAGTVGSISNPASSVSNFHRHLRAAAARGITVFMAIGDWGSNNLVGDLKCHVSYPNADPFVSSCGGTILGNPNPVPPPALDEYSWSDANLPSPFNSGPPPPVYEATGGGVSDQFPRPPYQIAVGVLPISKNDGGIRRGVPDVAGMVAMSGFFIKGVGGQAGYGTSAVAPLYAGLTATINAFLGRNVGFLNPTLYKYGPQICNDVKKGNNDSGNVPDAPFYTADVGWDPCTGWGSINGLRLLAAVAPAPIISTLVPDSGDFGPVCVEGFVEEVLTINNSGFSTLLIWTITSSLPAFEIPSVASFPLAVAPGDSIDVVIRFRPTAVGFAVGTITIFSNDLFNPKTVRVTGTGVAPRLVLGIADSGNFGNVCIGSFRDEPLVINNGGQCTLLVSNIACSSVEFLVPEVLSYPIAVAAGTSVSLPIRFQPTHLGATPAGTVITVDSNDVRGPQSIRVSGEAPAGKLVVTGSTFFGAVQACCTEERTISICNVGDCKLHVSSVEFKRKNHHWKLINNPFPATLHPGSCLAIVIRYKATERYPRPCELVITSDDPTDPVKILELLAATIWSDSCCRKCCDGCRRSNCDTRHCDPSCCKCQGTDEHDHDEEHERKEHGDD